jgi:hypothetical protein
MKKKRKVMKVILRNRKMCFSYGDIADARGCARGTVRNDVYNNKFDPQSLTSLSLYVLKMDQGGL